MNTGFTTGEQTCLLITPDHEVARLIPGAGWKDHYARVLPERIG